MRLEGGQEMVDELERSYKRQIAGLAQEIAIRDARITQLESALITAHSGRGVTNQETEHTGQVIPID
jgi:hypothetical protein